MILLKDVTFLRSIDGFSSVEYLIIFNAIIYGFITSYYFSGWGNMIQKRKKTVISYEHLAWTIFTFLTLVTNWYGTWHRVEFVNNSIWFFLFSLVSPLIYYFIAVLLFPSEDIKGDYGKCLDKNKHTLFAVFAGTFLMSIINGVVYEENDWIDPQNAIRLMGVILASVGVLIRSKILHIFILGLGFLMLIVFLFTVPSIS